MCLVYVRVRMIVRVLSLGTAQTVHEFVFTPWNAASHDRIEKPSLSRTLVYDNMSSWEQQLCYIVSVTPCEHLVRRTRTPQHQA